jgi:hypothetical protein
MVRGLVCAFIICIFYILNIFNLYYFIIHNLFMLHVHASLGLGVGVRGCEGVQKEGDCKGLGCLPAILQVNL